MASTKLRATILVLSLLAYSTFTDANGPCKTPPPPMSTAPPPKSTAPPPKSTAPPPMSTAPPPKSTAPPPKSTAPPPMSTAPPPKSTAPPPKSTAPPPMSTAPPPKSTAPPPMSTPPAPASPPAVEHCPMDKLKLGVCAGLVNIFIGSPPPSKCCGLLVGLIDLEAAVCLCAAIKANVLGIVLDASVEVNLILSACQKSVPPGFQCA